MRKFVQGNLISLIAFAILAASMLSASRGAILPMLVRFGRFIFPFVVIWLVYRLIRARVSRAVKVFQEQMFQNIQNGMNPNVRPDARGASTAGSWGGSGGAFAGAKNTGEVLDLCPKCGSLQTSTHHCTG